VSPLRSLEFSSARSIREYKERNDLQKSENQEEKKKTLVFTSLITRKRETPAIYDGVAPCHCSSFLFCPLEPVEDFVSR
jgi:hypothetical protein